MRRSASVNAFISSDNEYTILGDGSMKIDPIIKERLDGMCMVLNSLEIDPEVWDDKNPIWKNTNNHVMFMLRRYYHEHETDKEMHFIMGSLIDHFVWLYVSFPEFRARMGWLTWFIIVYVTDNQFREETKTGLAPEPWNDPRSWALAAEQAMYNPITTTLTKLEEPE